MHGHRAAGRMPSVAGNGLNEMPELRPLAQSLPSENTVRFVTVFVPATKRKRSGGRWNQSSAAPKSSQSAQIAASAGASKPNVSFVPALTKTNPRSRSPAAKGGGTLVAFCSTSGPTSGISASTGSRTASLSSTLLVACLAPTSRVKDTAAAAISRHSGQPHRAGRRRSPARGWMPRSASHASSQRQPSDSSETVAQIASMAGYLSMKRKNAPSVSIPKRSSCTSRPRAVSRARFQPAE